MRWILLAALAVSLTGCSSISYNYDWDQDAQFGAYKTFAWMPDSSIARSAPRSNADAAIKNNDLLDRRIRRAVEEELIAKGFTKAEGTGDFMVAYHVGSADKISITDWGYGYGGPYWGGYGRDIDVYQYQQGTLILDLIDTNAKELVWRGTATKPLDDRPTPESIDRTVNTVVGTLLKRFPPREGSRP